MALRARREGSADAGINGLRPTNVPAYTLKLQLGYRVAGLPGLELLANGLYESERIVLPDNSLSIPGVTRIDLGLRYEQSSASARWCGVPASTTSSARTRGANRRSSSAIRTCSHWRRAHLALSLQASL